VSWDPRAVIDAKRQGDRVDDADLRRLIEGYIAGAIGDGPMAAFLMACVVRGLDERETAAMTGIFVDSGSRLPLDGLGRPVVDKHSTGGVADGVSLVFAPLVAALGLACVKIAGRGLGHTGGTIDKLEAIPGFRVNRSLEEMRRQAAEIGCVIASQTTDLVPADRAIYALRDATATVHSIPLIAASVMAKKLAIGSDLIVLDVKVGSGAFMTDVVDATSLAETCLGIARDAERSAIGAITDMSQPLGTAIGNALEVAEAIEVLRGARVGLLRDLTVELAGHCLAASTHIHLEEATAAAAGVLADGSALRSFRDLVRAQGGDPRVVDAPGDVLPRAPARRPLTAARGGTLVRTDAAALGEAARALGAGRRRPGEPIDPAVGIVLTPKVGDRLEPGEPIGEVHARDEDDAKMAANAVRAALTIGDGPAGAFPLVHRWIGEVS
jgi:pyrimidine-nucleoside phosphorylase